MSCVQVISEYRAMLPWYEDFAQRRQVARIKKLLDDRKKLPMAPFEQTIVQVQERQKREKERLHRLGLLHG
jgi:hypothetical protein